MRVIITNGSALALPDCHQDLESVDFQQNTFSMNNERKALKFIK